MNSNITKINSCIYTKIHGGIANNPVKKSIPIKMLIAKIFSPADFVVIAPNGKKVGKNFLTNQEINEIPGAFYSGFNTDDEYVTIPDPLDGEYEIQLKGTGSGEYTFETTYISDTADNSSEITGTITQNQITDLSLDLDSRHPEDITLEKSVTIDTFIADVQKSYGLSWIDGKTKDRLLKEAQTIIKFEKKGTEKAKKKVDKIIVKMLEKELETFLSKKAINQQAYNLFKQDLNCLLNNN